MTSSPRGAIILVIERDPRGNPQAEEIDNLSGERAEPTKGTAQPRRPPPGARGAGVLPPAAGEAANERAEGEAQGRGPTVGSIPVGGVSSGKGPGRVLNLSRFVRTYTSCFLERRWCRWTAYDGGRRGALGAKSDQGSPAYPRSVSEEFGGDDQLWSVEGQEVVMNRGNENSRTAHEPRVGEGAGALGTPVGEKEATA